MPSALVKTARFAPNKRRDRVACYPNRAELQWGLALGRSLEHDIMAMLWEAAG
jgi:hypothetical protein